MNQEPGKERLGHEANVISNVDYASLQAEALEQNHETFAQRATRAEQESDPEFASDLRFAAQVSSALKEDGKRALVVGGYARDEAISRETGEPQKSKDLDMEVYGLEFQELTEYLERFGQVNLVGESFLIAKVQNPETGQLLDFSVPRADSKVDKGHKGFQVTASPDMTVREAARRRDLTINALALDPLTGELIDEYGGLQDIKDKTLRATDPELFGDDPLRALRVMQFAGRFGYEVERATAGLCRSFDLTELPRERVGEEWIKLMTQSERPSAGIAVARDLGILQQLHPELAVLESIKQEPDWHPEGNVLNHSMLAADAAARLVREEELGGEEALVVLFGALVHDLGKATTTEPRMKGGQMRITAHGHEAAGVQLAADFLHGLKMPNDVIAKVQPIVRDHLYHVHIPEPTNKQLQKFAQRLQPANIRLWDMVSRCDSNGRQGDYRERTGSYAIYERSLGLNVSEAPVPHIVLGGAIIETLGIEAGPKVSAAAEWLYDVQLDGTFHDAEGGLAYATQHPDEREAAIAATMALREQAHEQAAAERAKKTDEARAIPKAERRRIAKGQREYAQAEKERIAVKQAERAHLKAEKEQA